MRIAIIENDSLPEGFEGQGRRLADYYSGFFQASGARGWTFDVFHAPAGELPAAGSQHDAYVLTGSHADAFADDPWVVALRARVTALLDARKTVVGICFGHQLIAHCLGAPVGRAPGGWTIGLQPYRWREGEGAFNLLASHQDQVLALPEGAKLLASGPTCPVAGYTVGDHVYSVQPHPEFDVAFLEFIIRRRRERLGDHHADEALRSLAHTHDGPRIGEEMIAFITGRAAAAERRTRMA